MSVTSLTIIGNVNEIPAVGDHVDQYANAISGAIPCRNDQTPFNPTHCNSLTGGSVATIGTSIYPFKNIHLAGDGKIFKGPTEFSGGSGGAGLEIAENKSHLEKQGINYPLSNDLICNESMTDSTNVVITPRVSYTSGSSLVADYNKTDIDLMNATTGWTAGTNTPTISQDTTNKIEGTGSVKFAKTQSGSIDMYKTFTAFSLVDNLLSFSFFPNTISNITRAYVTIESSANYSSTYYIPVANITASAWNHISIDPNNDTKDAQGSSGAAVLGSITKITFGYTSSSSVAMEVSVDFIVYQPNWLLTVPSLYYIWNATTHDELKIASVAGTSNHQRRTYTITALSNAYAVGSSYAKMRNVTIANNQAVIPSGLSGAVAKVVYDTTPFELTQSVSGKTLYMSQRWWDEEFKVSKITDANNFKIYSATDKSGYFKDNNLGILFHKKWNGKKWVSKYNSTWGSNFKLVTLNGNAGTFASSEIPITVDEIITGMDTSEYYFVRYSAEMLYKVEAMSVNGALNILTPTEFKLSGGDVLFSDNFNRGDGAIGNNWTPTTISSSGTFTALSINSNTLYTYCTGNSSLVNSNILRNSENYTKYNLEVNLSFYSDRPTANNTTHLFQITMNDSVSGDKGFAVRFDRPSDTITVYRDGVLVNSTSFAISNATYYYLKIQFLPSKINVKLWTMSSTEPISWTISINVASTTGLDGYFKISSYLINNGSAGAITPTIRIDNLVIKDANIGYITRGSIDNQSGDKLVTATKLTREEDTTNQNPVLYQRDAIIGG